MPPGTPFNVKHDPRIPAAVDLIGRTGASQFKLQYCDEESPPVVWIAAAKWKDTWEVGAGLNASEAVFRLLDQVIDGGTCTHCKRPTGFEPTIDPMPLDNLVCWYQWDPERKTFRRGCEGNDS